MRGRSNNNRRAPNPLTRNYESNGPDVKIRGNAQHIADRYTALARDAQSSGDRIMTENYLQHAEHYLRIILSAQTQIPPIIVRDDSYEDTNENSPIPIIDLEESVKSKEHDSIPLSESNSIEKDSISIESKEEKKAEQPRKGAKRRSTCKTESSTGIKEVTQNPDSNPLKIEKPRKKRRSTKLEENKDKNQYTKIQSET
jgi:hypothetical protein